MLYLRKIEVLVKEENSSLNEEYKYKWNTKQLNKNNYILLYVLDKFTGIMFSIDIISSHLSLNYFTPDAE